eukprot:scaffold766_cov179-Amphora_coffeaeformis.AAC.19
MNKPAVASTSCGVRSKNERPFPAMARCGKRARGIKEVASSRWKDFVVENVDHQPWTFKDLFGQYNSVARKAVVGHDCNDDAENNFYTFRLEHRESGVLARHVGEERILLFRSDRPGAIGKIIFSCDDDGGDDDGVDNCANDDDNNRKKQSKVLRAKIYVLDVKEQYRGFDLGGLLCSQAMAVLQNRYSLDGTSSSSICCRLDAEEDCRRHNKLVRFYQEHGFEIKPNTKVQYINNNDGETYRKIPMQRTISTANRCSHEKHNNLTVLTGRPDTFLPIRLEGQYREPLLYPSPNNDRCGTLLLVNIGDGTVAFCTTYGYQARAYPNGKLQMDCTCDEDAHDSWSRFHLIRLANTKSPPALSSTPEEDCKAQESRLSEKGFWLLQSVAHGTFLSLDENLLNVGCADYPTFWQAQVTNNGQCILSCATKDTPLRRYHYLCKWQTQTVEYVQSMREKYLSFQLCSMTLEEAILEKAKFIDAGYLDVASNHFTPSLRTVCFRTADWFRRQGYPDWVQLIALVFSLGRVVKIVDPLMALRSSNNDDDVKDSCHDHETDYDWTIPSQGWVLGCGANSTLSVSSIFSWMNPYQKDGDVAPAWDKYNKHNSNSKHNQKGSCDTFCGLDKVLLTWSSQEYMSELLQHNRVDLPEEAYAMLRLSLLSDWHTKGEYRHYLYNDGNDDDLVSFVADFYEALEQAIADAMTNTELAQHDCERLWCTWYQAIAEKYGADDVLCW